MSIHSGRPTSSQAPQLRARSSRPAHAKLYAVMRKRVAPFGRPAIVPVLGVTWMLLGAMLTPRAVAGHSAYLRSSPNHGATVTSTPALLEVWFDAPLFARPNANYVEILNVADDRVVFRGEGTIDPADDRHLLVGLPTVLPPGDYEVIWQTLSALDGDRADGSFVFAIDPAGTTREVPPFRTTTDSPSRGSTGQEAEPVARDRAEPVTDVPAWARQTGPAVLLLVGVLAVISVLRRGRS